MTHLKHYFEKTPENKRSSSAIAYLAALDHLEETAPKVAASIVQELRDQRSRLKVIASENYCSLSVQLAMGNLLTDKYAEGIPEHRFYAGCQNVDAIEKQAAAELIDIFGADHAYVQPHSGADANIVAFFAILTEKVQNKALEKLGQTKLDALSKQEVENLRQLFVNQKVLGMSLNAGGHLTHGYLHNISSKLMQAFHYDVDPKTGLVDYAEIAKQAKEVKPTILLAGYSAYPRLINFAKMAEIASDVGATLMVDMAHFSGLVAGGALKGEFNPIPYADMCTSTTHKTMRGPRGGMVLCKKELAESVNKGCPLVMGGPLPHVMAAKAVAFQEANTNEFQTYAHKIIENAKSLASSLKEQGLKLVTDGTDNHLIIIDVSPFEITGRQAELALTEAHITCSRNSIPFDKNGAWYTSGIRIGTAAMTTLGMGQEEMKQVATIIADVLKQVKPTTVARTGMKSQAKYTIDPATLKRAQERVKELLGNFPLYPEIVLKNGN